MLKTLHFFRSLSWSPLFHTLQVFPRAWLLCNGVPLFFANGRPTTNGPHLSTYWVFV